LLLNYKKASILFKLGTNVDCTIAFVKGILNLKFPVTMATRGDLKIAHKKQHYFVLMFSIKTD
jgi:hypothetical protein